MDKWEKLKEYLIEYERDHNGCRTNSEAVYGRYCVAISIEDLLEKMKEFEEEEVC